MTSAAETINAVDVTEVMNSAPVIPVLVIKRIEDAVPLAKALVAGGLRVLEVTLRTECAVAAIEAIVDQVPDALVGAGTVTTVEQFRQVEQAGAQFAISPGATEELLKAGRSSQMAYLPAISTVSELMTAKAAGYSAFKFFPAESSGGVAALKSISGPFPDVRFCPTGGVSAGNYLEYLALPNVACVGGSWIVPTDLIEAGDWDAIVELAQECVSKARLAIDTE